MYWRGRQHSEPLFTTKLQLALALASDTKRSRGSVELSCCIVANLGGHRIPRLNCPQKDVCSGIPSYTLNQSRIVYTDRGSEVRPSHPDDVDVNRESTFKTTRGRAIQHKAAAICCRTDRNINAQLEGYHDCTGGRFQTAKTTRAYTR